MLVLAMDTSTPIVTAGVARVLRPNELIEVAAAGGAAEPVTLLTQHTCNDPFGHAERLMPLVTAALAESGAAMTDLDAVVVGLGPGPFTGLRVGIATAEALGDGLSRPVFGVPSHDAVAMTIANPSDAALVVTDARRREVYVSAYNGDHRRIAGPDVLAPAALGDFVTALPVAPTGIAGAGADLAGLDLPPLPAGPVALGLALAAGPWLVTGAVPGPLTPLYLRRPDAIEPTAPTGLTAGKSVLR